MATDRSTPQESAADHIRELLEITGWTQVRLAEELKVTQPTISRWLSGKQDPNYEQTMRIRNLSFRSLGDDRPENISSSISLLGHIDGSLKIKIAPNSAIYEAKLKYGMSGAGLNGFIISSKNQTPLGSRGWIVLCSPGYTLPIVQGAFYLITLPDRSLFLRQIYIGSEDDAWHLLAPGLEPMFDATVAIAMTVVGVIAPNAIHEPLPVDMSEYDSA